MAQIDIENTKVVTETIKRAEISVRGIVQGVGFRPFVFQLASQQGLKGWVTNTSGEVKIEVEGPFTNIQIFLEKLKTEAPPLALIEEINYLLLPPVGYSNFTIRESKTEKGKYQRISPDIATCFRCRQEIFNPQDRRYRYPFTNCTNCGPRFTIIEDIPYDRLTTTMKKFKMCPKCEKEYNDPNNRRFHAQPNCCPVCGPQLELVDNQGRQITTYDPIFAAANLLKRGKIIAIKGLGGFLLACDATQDEVVKLLRRRKRRLFKPFAVMMRDLDEIKKYCFISSLEEELLVSTRAPIVLLKLKDKNLISPEVAPNLNYFGVMLPYTPLHHLLLREVSFPLVMTSGNISEEPIAKDNEEALKRLANIADYFLWHNRDIHIQFDDSVAMVERNEIQVLRRARSYAPDPIQLSFKARSVLACGAELKNTFCFTKDYYAFISQHIGDLDNLETLAHFEKVLKHYKQLFRLEPQIIAHDKHPDYISTLYARELKAKDDGLILVPIQHHHAHIISCLIENKVSPPVLGVAFDGTGYGEDGKIWGGEFLLVEYDNYQRKGHLEYVPMPGGEKAIKHPYRMTLSYLMKFFGERSLNYQLPFLPKIKPVELEVIKNQIIKGINSPLTSSGGRLFDAVSALLSICLEVDYEGQAAIELEMVAKESEEIQPYPFEIRRKDGIKVVSLEGIFAGILDDLTQGRSKEEIAFRFHYTVAEVITEMVQILSGETGIKKVALSGGVFQNRLLLRLSARGLEKAGFQVITHREVPTNDGGVSLGQAVIANFQVDNWQKENFDDIS